MNEMNVEAVNLFFMITTGYKDDILKKIPHRKPFRFIDEILDINDHFIKGAYTYRHDEFFYKGHFPDNPVTPGVILTETMAQIGLLALGIHLSGLGEEEANVFFVSSDVRFLQVVYPGSRIIVEAEKIYFRHNQLKCSVTMYRQPAEPVCTGILSGMFLKGLRTENK